MKTARQCLRSFPSWILPILTGLVPSGFLPLCHAGDQTAVQNAVLSVSLNPADGALSVVDKRTGQVWRQKAVAQGKLGDLVRDGRRIETTWQDSRTGLKVRMSLEVDQEKPEIAVALAAEGVMRQSLRWPGPFVTGPATYLVVPMNEGISYPVDDETVETRKLIAYGGHGICMPFWGATDGQRGYMAILETPDDASIQIARQDGKLCIWP
jgi:hypothetical protein